MYCWSLAWKILSITLLVCEMSPKNKWRLFSEKAMAPHSSILPGKSCGWRSLIGHSPLGRWESDMTERLHFHFSLSCIWEGNGNPLQCSCLENPRDGGAWWAAIYGVAESQRQLKLLSSSSSNILGREDCSCQGILVSPTSRILTKLTSLPFWNWRHRRWGTLGWELIFVLSGLLPKMLDYLNWSIIYFTTAFIKNIDL